MSINESAREPSTSEIDENMLLQAALAQLKQLTDRVTALESAQLSATSPTDTQHSSPQVRGRDPFLHRQTGWQPTRR